MRMRSTSQHVPTMEGLNFTPRLGGFFGIQQTSHELVKFLAASLFNLLNSTQLVLVQLCSTTLRYFKCKFNVQFEDYDKITPMITKTQSACISMYQRQNQVEHAGRTILSQTKRKCSPNISTPGYRPLDKATAIIIAVVEELLPHVAGVSYRAAKNRNRIYICSMSH